MFENLKADFWISLYSTVSIKIFKKDSFVRGGVLSGFIRRSLSVYAALGANLYVMSLYQPVRNVSELVCM